MRLNDLLTSRVVAADGTELGAVRDVRLIQDGPPLGLGQAALRLDSLIVARGFGARLLGFGHSPVERPWVLRLLVRWLDRGHQIIDWDDVAEYADGVVTLKR